MNYISRFRRAGKNVRIHPDVFIEHPENIEVGDDVTFAKGVYICGKPKEFRVGSRVLIETNVYMILDDARLLIGDDVRLYPFVYISGGKNLVEVGNHTHFAPGCVIYGQGGTRVGNHCAFAAHTMLAGVAHDWHRADVPMDTTEISAPILIEDNVYTGANVVINMGVTIRTGCCIAANAVVLEDTEAEGFYAGTPAMRKCDRGT
ncbi:MAG: DapH/DapD/GlmU-related protein [Verrucomicrobiota bacterium]